MDRRGMTRRKRLRTWCLIPCFLIRKKNMIDVWRLIRSSWWKSWGIVLSNRAIRLFIMSWWENWRMKVTPKSVNVVRLFLWTKSIAVIVVKR
jgi:RyR domain.